MFSRLPPLHSLVSLDAYALLELVDVIITALAGSSFGVGQLRQQVSQGLTNLVDR
jgi:hypothetical protein